jgi:hypothetical protein
MVVCAKPIPRPHIMATIAIAQFVTEIPANAQHYDLPVEVPTFEQLLDRYESRHPFIIPASRVCTRTVETYFVSNFVVRVAGDTGAVRKHIAVAREYSYG